MGFLKQLDSNADPQTFPGASFEISGEVPESQCSEARVEGDNGQFLGAPPTILDPGRFVGEALVGKFFTITSGLLTVPQTRQIVQQNDNALVGVPPALGSCGFGDYYVHNGGSLILTRDIPSFAAYLSNLGIPYTIKGAKLYTDATAEQLQPACSILFDPIT